MVYLLLELRLQGWIDRSVPDAHGSGISGVNLMLYQICSAILISLAEEMVEFL